MDPDADDFLPTRRSLLSRLRSWRNDESWMEFFNTYGQLIHGAARKAGLSESEAQDVTQETIISVAKTMPEYQYDPSRCSFKGWLRHLTEKRIVDHYRKRRKESLAGDIEQDIGSNTDLLSRTPDPRPLELEATWDGEWEKNLATVALKKLQLRVSASHYQVFHLHVIEEKSAREVATLVGMNTGQVYLIKHRLTRVLKKLVRELKVMLARGELGRF